MFGCLWVLFVCLDIVDLFDVVWCFDGLFVGGLVCLILGLVLGFWWDVLVGVVCCVVVFIVVI